MRQLVYKYGKRNDDAMMFQNFETVLQYKKNNTPLKKKSKTRRNYKWMK